MSLTEAIKVILKDKNIFDRKEYSIDYPTEEKGKPKRTRKQAEN